MFDDSYEYKDGILWLRHSNTREYIPSFLEKAQNTKKQRVTISGYDQEVWYPGDTVFFYETTDAYFGYDYFHSEELLNGVVLEGTSEVSGFILVLESSRIKRRMMRPHRLFRSKEDAKKWLKTHDVSTYPLYF